MTHQEYMNLRVGDVVKIVQIGTEPTYQFIYNLDGKRTRLPIIAVVSNVAEIPTYMQQHIQKRDTDIPVGCRLELTSDDGSVHRFNGIDIDILTLEKI